MKPNTNGPGVPSANDNNNSNKLPSSHSSSSAGPGYPLLFWMVVLLSASVLYVSHLRLYIPKQDIAEIVRSIKMVDLVGGENQNDHNNNNNNNNNVATAMTTSTMTTVGIHSRGQSNLLMEEESKPWLILHIGPCKTGTTSIQCTLHKYSKELMDLDNYYYMGAFCASTQETKMPNNESDIESPQWAWHINGYIPSTEATDDIFQRLDEHQRQGHNVIISAEHLFSATRTDKANINELWEEGLKSKISGFNVKAVLVHRFLLDWVPSQYYQVFVGYGKPAPPFSKFLDDVLTHWETSGGRNHIDAYLDFLPYHQLWSQHFDINIMDFYSEEYDGDVSHHFICDYIPDANKTCQFAARDKLKTKTDGTHARASGSVQQARAFFHAMDLYNFTNPEETSYGKIRLMFLKNCNNVFAKYGIESDPSYLDCINPAQEARLRNYSATVMQVYHERQNGKSMTEQELALGMARQDASFEMNKAKWKYCGVSLERLFSNDTISRELMEFTLPE